MCNIYERKDCIIKERIVGKHTLEAVFSMPDELFYNSDKSVVTCIMVFTAHKPHSKDKETFFGYFKDDGFEKRKKLGRIDVHNRWGQIKEEWLRLYRNRREIAGKSVMHHVSAKTNGVQRHTWRQNTIEFPSPNLRKLYGIMLLSNIL